ncbi:MAG: 1-acyl-sn-glycerol-3-phosphate acyltransferase [Lentisphaeria bacterium]|nr:1-acyl-sn-glycerol-3-phosphate acyltransferase [Candidatus Neomarinimicrobiota bacterium]MCF7841906.1 1-acyl-sn-glycerol-3-phosphate acyltransferase [Lentisphaeria bacterium]
MRALLSILLWTAGGLVFLLVVLVVAVGILTLGRDGTYPLMRGGLRILTTIMGLPVIVSGKHHIPRDRPVIFMGNHESLFDVFAIPVGIPKPFVGVEAAEHFSWPAWGWIVRRWGNIPIPRENLQAAKQSLEIARRRITEEDVSIGILPEGTRTLTGEIGEFKKGPFHLALAAGADIVPFAMDGLYRYKSKHSWILHPTLCRIRFGPPIRFSTFSGQNVEMVRDLVRERIIGLKLSIVPEGNQATQSSSKTVR